MIVLKTTDGLFMEIEEEFAVKSVLLKNIMNFIKTTEPIEILVDYNTLEIVYSFMKKDNHVLLENYNPLEIYFSEENFNFLKELTPNDVVKVCDAANYLEYYFLLELSCKVIANGLSENSQSELAELIKGAKTVDDIIVNNYKREYNWFDD